jgi:CBS-domain-containing membrane protein
MSLATPIVQIIDRDPETVDIRQRFSDAARKLASKRFHHLPVVDGERLVGMLSAVDLLRLNADKLDAADQANYDLLDRCYRIGDIMQRNVITVSDRATVGDAARLLSAGGFHCVPVVNAADDRLVGIITTTDLVGHMLAASPGDELPALVQQRLKALEGVFSAAQSYLLSGMAVQEHETLERAIDDARRTGLSGPSRAVL